jgi:hypothetical protein
MEVKLQPPGAGLPKPELIIARIMFRTRCALTNYDSYAKLFKEERVKIKNRYSNLSDDDAKARVIIKRLPGLEDSSRFWSVYMTLDHLRIVNSSIADIVAKLSNGIKPEGAASTAAVKPSEQVTGLIKAEYESSCDLVLKSLSEANNKVSSTTFPHPWFGDMTYKNWAALVGSHMGIHRKQISSILEAQS